MYYQLKLITRVLDPQLLSFNFTGGQFYQEYIVF